MNTGRLQRRWQESEPAVFDKETRIVRMDIQAETKTDEEGNEVSGFSFVEVQIDKVIDYGHVKSQLIEAGFAQKEEFAMLMNSVRDVIKAGQSGSQEEASDFMQSEAITSFMDFCDFRDECAKAAKAVMAAY